MRPAVTAYCGELPALDAMNDADVIGNAGQRMGSASLFSIQVWSLWSLWMSSTEKYMLLFQYIIRFSIQPKFMNVDLRIVLDVTVGHADVLISLDSRLLKIDGEGDLAVDEDADVDLDVDPHFAGHAGRYWAAKLLQPLVKPNLKPSVRDRIDEVLEMPKGYEYVEVLRQNHYERHYRNRSGHTATRGIPLNSVERKRKKKYFLRKVRADDDGDQTTFASVPQKDSLLLVENLRGRLG